MPRFFIEVTQESDVATVKRIKHSVRAMGSHFATHADWKRNNDVCTGTMIVEAMDRWSAINVVPPSMRAQAQVFRLKSAMAA